MGYWHKGIIQNNFRTAALSLLRFALCALPFAFSPYALRSRALRFFLRQHCSTFFTFFALRSALSALRLSFFAPCSLLLAFLLLFSFPNSSRADFSDFLAMFHPYLTIQEEYNDNIYLTRDNKKDDFITTIYPGIRFSTSPARVTTPGQIQQGPERPAGLDLDYRLGLVYYSREKENDYVSHEGNLNTWYTFDRRLTFRLRDYFIRSEEPREREYIVGALPEQYILGTQRQRYIYWRNVLEPSLDYRFGPDDRISVSYRNNYYETKDPAAEDSRENYISPRLTYWFTIRHGLLLEYGFTHGDFEVSPDFIGNNLRGRYTYRFDPRTSVFVQYVFLKRDFDSPGIDYEVNNPSMGIEHAFSPTFSGRAQVGYFWQKPERGSSADGFFFDMGITQREIRTVFTLSLQGGYREDFFTAENLGFTKYYRVLASLTHNLDPRFSMGAAGALERAEFLTDRKDWLYSIRGFINYQILRWLSLSFEAGHRANDSNVDIEEYTENRILFRLSATL